ncbi:hypothetical protein HanRHA438_Chr07g0311531 [Helianthus annuus]|uniref:F-box protein At3g26010-like beta-propeller domain-containing protein n=1 Tax=Helianthus annuus TaxID=4232 RepID=A0A9K3IMN6_HELAN|nr:hypothetical protein HanXRQr2_Chr07g0301601 [Helianthus annuus]KAJ0563613.1 hypothetical protein HanHA89_Chr07g0265091 [Helianthus annuus]KAJ0728948.1 hypothetical protein HanLR1_Chr07g0247431 [Helianthus annuus]KAJ0731705.1 hypothetical protein HanOQP8_Chr07g0254991 [Helianthus annuus]KAJ0908538.1 hypothetical protein HanRHA438_Chr07g0311531 [Helianthus annuus]
MGLAFDPTVSPHYKIIYPGQWPGGVVHVEIYSSETGNWNSRAAQTNLSLSSFVTFDSGVVYWHGAIHWLSRIGVYHLSLELDDEEENILQVEEDPSIRYYTRDKLFVSRGCLLLVKMLHEPEPPLQMNVYEMKNNSYSSGWSLRYHVNLQSAGSFLGPYFNVLALVLGEREEDSFLVLEDNLSSMLIIQYNIRSNTFHQGVRGAHLLGESPLLHITNHKMSRQLPSNTPLIPLFDGGTPLLGELV